MPAKINPILELPDGHDYLDFYQAPPPRKRATRREKPKWQSEQAGKEKERITTLKRQAVEAKEKLSRLYRAIEDGLADLDDPNLKGRIIELKRIRDSAEADVERPRIATRRLRISRWRR